MATVLEHIQDEAFSWECLKVLWRIELVNCATLGLPMPERYYPTPGGNHYEDNRWGIQVLAQRYLNDHQGLLDGCFKQVMPTEIKVGDKLYLGRERLTVSGKTDSYGQIATITSFAPNWWDKTIYRISFWADVEPKDDSNVKRLKVNLNAAAKHPLYINLW